MKTVMMPRTLTAENGAKAAMNGEFTVDVVMICECCEGDGWLDEDAGEECPKCTGAGDYMEKIKVPWTTIKEIYAKAVECCGT